MKQKIEELKSIPGVIGGCLYTREGIKASNLPGLFKPERLAAICKPLARLYAAGRMSFADLNDLSVHYDEAVIVVRELEKNLLLCVVCNPGFNLNLLTMSFNLLQEDARSGRFDEPEQAPAAFGEAAAPRIDTARQRERLPGLLQEMRLQLGKVYGPMAGFIFDESLELWQQRSDGTPARLDELVDLLEREIADPEKIGRYQQLIDAKIRAFREE